MVLFLFLGLAAVRGWKRLVVCAVGTVACRSSDITRDDAHDAHNAIVSRMRQSGKFEKSCLNDIMDSH